MGLTKREALEITEKLWSWLADTGCEWKGDWPGWEDYGEMDCNCALCQYVAEQREEALDEDDYAERNCELCPLYGKWGKALRCYDDLAPFEDWSGAQYPSARKRYAGQIAKLCAEELKRLDSEL